MFLENYESAWTDDSIRHIATPSERARSTFYYVQEIGYFKTLSHYFTERSGLNSYLMIYTIKGIGHLHYEGNDYDLKPGMIMFIDCNKHHYYKTDESALWEIQWAHICGSNINGFYDQFREHHSPVIQLPEDNVYSEWLDEMLKLHTDGHIEREIRCSRLITNCLTQMLMDAQSYSVPGHMPQIIQSVQTYLDHHYAESITLDMLSHQFGISKYHLSRLFRQYTGFSPIDYQISLRITMAKNLLQFTNKSIRIISQDVGIDNVSHFINVFKKREAMTPLQFRKTC